MMGLMKKAVPDQLSLTQQEERETLTALSGEQGKTQNRSAYAHLDMPVHLVIRVMTG